MLAQGCPPYTLAIGGPPIATDCSVCLRLTRLLLEGLLQEKGWVFMEYLGLFPEYEISTSHPNNSLIFKSYGQGMYSELFYLVALKWLNA